MIEHVAFGINRCLGRVEIFRHVIAQRTSSEGHDLSRFIGNRKGDAPPKPVKEPTAALITGQDRKSTRLNSSHLVISYAVFCLKKKKDTIMMKRLNQIR